MYYVKYVIHVYSVYVPITKTQNRCHSNEHVHFRLIYIIVGGGWCYTIVTKYFDRFISIIRKIWIIGADSALVYSLIHTIHTSYTWDGLMDRTSPLRIRRAAFVQNYSRVWDIPDVVCNTLRASAFSYFSIGESRLKCSSCLFTPIRLPLFTDRFTRSENHHPIPLRCLTAN